MQLRFYVMCWTDRKTQKNSKQVVETVSSPLHFLKISFVRLTSGEWEIPLTKGVVADSDVLGKVILQPGNLTWGSSRTQLILNIQAPSLVKTISKSIIVSSNFPNIHPITLSLQQSHLPPSLILESPYLVVGGHLSTLEGFFDWSKVWKWGFSGASSFPNLTGNQELKINRFTNTSNVLLTIKAIAKVKNILI